MLDCEDYETQGKAQQKAVVWKILEDHHIGQHNSLLGITNKCQEQSQVNVV